MAADDHNTFGIQPVHWKWRVLEKDARGNDRWRELRWMMTESEAEKWQETNSKMLEKVPGSFEIRSPVDLGSTAVIMRLPSGRGNAE